MRLWKSSLTVILGATIVIGFMTPGLARELDFDVYRMLAVGMSEGEILSRAGEPDKRVEQFEPTKVGQALVSYQYVYVGDMEKGEWTTTITISAKTSKVTQISRDRR